MTEPSTSGPCDVLVVSASVGAGHVQAARALVEGLRQADASLAVQHVDVLDFMSWYFRMFYSGGFKLGMTHLQRAYATAYWLTDRPQTARRGLFERMRLADEYRSLKRFRRFLLQRRPPLILNTHFLAPPAIGRMMRRGELATRQMTVVTDNVVHRFWYCEETEHYFVPTEQSAATVLQWGIDQRRITVSGIPIHPKWAAPLDRAKVLADWRLPADKDIILLSGGTDFTCGPVVAVARSILDACPRAAVVVLAGRNKDLLADLSKAPGVGTRLFPQGFTDRAQELADICSMMVTKPGGITTAECLAKGVPMILLKPVPGQEGGNANYLAREGAAIITDTKDDIIAAVKRLMDDKAALSAMRDNARRLYRPATQTIAKAVIGAVRTPGSDKPAAEPQSTQRSG